MCTVKVRAALYTGIAGDAKSWAATTCIAIITDNMI